MSQAAAAARHENPTADARCGKLLHAALEHLFEKQEAGLVAASVFVLAFVCLGLNRRVFHSLTHSSIPLDA